MRTTIRVGVTANRSRVPGLVTALRRDIKIVLQGRGFSWVRDGFERMGDMTPEELRSILNELHVLELGRAPGEVRSMVIQSRRIQVSIRRSNNTGI